LEPSWPLWNEPLVVVNLWHVSLPSHGFKEFFLLFSKCFWISWDILDILGFFSRFFRTFSNFLLSIQPTMPLVVNLWHVSVPSHGVKGFLIFMFCQVVIPRQDLCLFQCCCHPGPIFATFAIRKSQSYEETKKNCC
jgi:hypothetical protein